MSENNAVVGYNSHTEAEATIKELQTSGPSDALAENFFGPVSLTTVCPEAALMCAVLEDAFFCFQKQFEIERSGMQRTAQEAEEWFFSDESYGLFSFVSICTVLGLEPEFIRKGLKHWSQSRLDTPQRKQRNMQRVIGACPAPTFVA
jgi:hypothetical protein